MDIYRCKGVLSVQNSNQLHTLQVANIHNILLADFACAFIYVFMGYWQAVKEIYEIVPARDWKKDEKPMNKIVFIGNT